MWSRVLEISRRVDSDKIRHLYYTFWGRLEKVKSNKGPTIGYQQVRVLFRIVKFAIEFWFFKKNWRVFVAFWHHILYSPLERPIILARAILKAKRKYVANKKKYVLVEILFDHSLTFQKFVIVERSLIFPFESFFCIPSFQKASDQIWYAIPVSQKAIKFEWQFPFGVKYISVIRHQTSQNSMIEVNLGKTRSAWKFSQAVFLSCNFFPFIFTSFLLGVW